MTALWWGEDGSGQLSSASRHCCVRLQTHHQLTGPWCSHTACALAMHICGSPGALQLTAGSYLRPAFGTAFCSHSRQELYRQGLDR